jgi:hypothetical protein
MSLTLSINIEVMFPFGDNCNRPSLRCKVPTQSNFKNSPPSSKTEIQSNFSLGKLDGKGKNPSKSYVAWRGGYEKLWACPLYSSLDGHGDGFKKSLMLRSHSTARQFDTY